MRVVFLLPPVRKKREIDAYEVHMHHLKRVGIYDFPWRGFPLSPARIIFSSEGESKTLTRNESDPFNDILSDVLPTKAEQINVNKKCQYPKFSPVPEEEQHRRDRLGWDNKASMTVAITQGGWGCTVLWHCHRICQNARVEMSFKACLEDTPMAIIKHLGAMSIWGSPLIVGCWKVRRCSESRTALCLHP